ncbi:MAG: AAA family ATPase, partial [Verrucomicrobia bacterium]|nr:AAA family ATPase [Verrucomicrobiota bacterium]
MVNLALIGFMGTGKTSVGKIVADQLHFEFLDTDELI